jgi:hypothetical protein
MRELGISASSAYNLDYAFDRTKDRGFSESILTRQKRGAEERSDHESSPFP